MAQRYIVAIEIGSSKIRGAVGIVDSSGVVDVIAIEEEKLINSVRYGQVQNAEVGNAVSRIIEKLEKHPRLNQRKIKGIYVALGGRSMSSTMVDASLSLPGEQEVTQAIIDDLKRRAAQQAPTDREVVAVVPHTFVIDNKTQANPVGTYGERINAKFYLVTCAPQLKRTLQRALSERLGLEINDYVVRPLAEANAVLTDDEKRLGCMFVDFGAETTTVAIYKNGTFQSLSTLPIGSRNITLDLTTLNYIEERAEEIKKVRGNAMQPDGSSARSNPDGIDYTEINNYVHARAAEIVSNILAQADFAQIKLTELPGGIVIVGGGSKLKGFNELLSQQSNLKVRMGTPGSNVRISDGAVQGFDAVDVISLLLAAADGALKECVETVEPEPEQKGSTYEAGYGDDGDDVSRIGTLDDGDDDDYEDDDPDIIEKEPKAQKPKKPKGPSVIDKIRNKIEKLMNESEDYDDN